MQLTRLAFIIVGRPSRGGNANGAYTHHPSDHTHRRHDRRPGAGPRGEGQHRCSMLWSEPPSGCACMVSFAGVALKSGCTHCDAPQTNTQAGARCAAARARVSLSQRHWCVSARGAVRRAYVPRAARRGRGSRAGPRRSCSRLRRHFRPARGRPMRRQHTNTQKHTQTSHRGVTGSEREERHRRTTVPTGEPGLGGWVQRVKPARARPAPSAVRRRCGSRTEEGERGGDAAAAPCRGES